MSDRTGWQAPDVGWVMLETAERLRLYVETIESAPVGADPDIVVSI